MYSMLQYVHVCMYINIEIVRVTTAWGTRGCSARVGLLVTDNFTKLRCLDLTVGT